MPRTRATKDRTKQMIDMEKLSNGYTLIHVQFSLPGGTTKRGDLEQELANMKGMADSDLLSTRLVTYNNDKLKSVRKVHTELKKYVKSKTVAWDDRNFRLIKNSDLSEVEDRVQDAILKAEPLFSEFLADYPDHIERQKLLMGSAFSESDFPTVDALRSSHEIKINYQVVPDPDIDARAGMTADQAVRFKQSIERQNIEKLRHATNDVAERVRAAVEHFKDRMDNYDGTKKGSFNNTVVSNMRDIAKLLQSFNIGNDPQIDQVINTLVRDICTADPDELRKNDESRSKASEQAQDILSRIGSFGSVSD